MARHGKVVVLTSMHLTVLPAPKGETRELRRQCVFERLTRSATLKRGDTKTPACAAGFGPYFRRVSARLTLVAAQGFTNNGVTLRPFFWVLSEKWIRLNSSIRAAARPHLVEAFNFDN